MKKSLILFTMIATLASGSALAHEYQLGAIKIGHPWARATPKGASVAAGYLKITNTGSTPDRLVSGTAAFSGGFEVHEMTMKGGVMQMRPISGGLEIKPGETVELKPGSFHLMFTNLKHGLAKGERVDGTLTFEKAGTVSVQYAVEGMGGTPSGSHSGH